MMHPARMRIVQALIGGRRRTAQDLRTEMPDIPQATLYRQVNILVAGGMVEVVDQNRVRGTVERVFALNAEKSELISDFTEAARDEHLRVILAFTTKIVNDFSAYTASGPYDLLADLCTFRQIALQLTDDEARDLFEKVGALLVKASGNAPAPGRRTRLVSTIAMPAESPGGNIHRNRSHEEE